MLYFKLFKLSTSTSVDVDLYPAYKPQYVFVMDLIGRKKNKRLIYIQIMLSLKITFSILK